MKEDQKTSDDIFFLLTYMTAISTADIQRDKIFKYASEREEYSIAIYFKKMHILAVKMGYEYSKACKLISKKISNSNLSDLFGRMATALASGESEKDFLMNERETMGEIYSNQYENDVESLKKWTDGYTALLVSVSLIVTMLLISTMIYDMGDVEVMAALVLFIMVFICGMGILILYDSAPSEIKLHSLEQKSREQHIVAALSLILLPLGALAVGVLVYENVRIPYIFLTAAAFMAPIGIVGMIDDLKIEQRDKSFPAFAKSLGSLSGTMGVTTSTAMKKLDRESVGHLEPLIDRLYTRLTLDLDPDLCWEKFIGESGSELINRCTKIYNHAVNLGGDPLEIGKIVSSSSLAIVLLRMKRKMVSKGFIGLNVVMHAVMTGLLIFIIEMMKKFSEVLTQMYDSHFSEFQGASSTAGLGMSMFSVGSNIDFLYKFTIGAIIILTIADSLVVKVVDGGGNYKIYFYGAVMCLISALMILVVPLFVGKIFSFDF
ncbi:Flagella-related protein FlaJ [Methanosarcina sp. MTP4]|uniref:archaellar assembly protein FlaJ n=1 Tax=Methanosarcina sp. MTP4 TaxID=1434100 RepID=UPI000615EF7D|nr:archaellar assembly protein FlaJ [Methanosarcina sp. MTP4]AKB25734.1 Flagella-related protein FlaJ [Methanosarcina sp. MTP4]